jgi:hypothetical protein
MGRLPIHAPYLFPNGGECAVPALSDHTLDEWDSAQTREKVAEPSRNENTGQFLVKRCQRIFRLDNEWRNPLSHRGLNRLRQVQVGDSS